MDVSDIARRARALYQAHGDGAEAHAAQKARAARSFGDTALAEEWHRIRAAIRDLRSVPAS